MLIPKSLKDLLEMHGQMESRCLEFKSLQIENNSIPKSEKLLKSIQGMMNGIEPKCCIIIGLKEKNGEIDEDSITPISFPCKIDDMNRQIQTFDDYRRHLYQFIKDNTIPYYEGLVTINKIKVVDNQFIITIEVNQSTERPHKNSNGHRYIRRDGYTDQMSYHEEEIAMHEKRERLNLLSKDSNQNTSSYDSANEILFPLNDKPFVTLEPFGDTSRSQAVSLLEGPYIFLRIIPSCKKSLSPHSLRQYLQKSNLPPLGYYTNWWTEVNESGAVVFQQTAHDETKAYNLTQVNRDGSIEGIDTYILNPNKSILDKEVDFSYLPVTSVEDIFIKAMRNYLAFAERNLELELPIMFKAGIVGIMNYKLAIPQKAFQNPFVGKSVDDTIIEEGIVTQYNQTPEMLLNPFFEKIWYTFGQKRLTTT